MISRSSEGRLASQGLGGSLVKREASLATCGTARPFFDTDNLWPPVVSLSLLVPTAALSTIVDLFGGTRQSVVS